jgi:hypothetical protein
MWQEKSLGKRKEAPPPDPADNISERECNNYNEDSQPETEFRYSEARLRHRPTLRSPPGYATRAKTAGWSHAAAFASEDIEMSDISHTHHSG